MDFRIKCMLQRAFSILPAGSSMNYFFQRHISRSLPVSDEEFLARVQSFYARFTRLTALGLKPGTYYEFGSGWDLIAPITFRLLGFERLICIDLRPLIKAELIRNTVERFARLRDRIPFTFPDLVVPERITPDLLTREFGIEYRAPCDATATGLPGASVDLAFSNNVLEHVPAEVIPGIFSECRRLLKSNGFCDFQIDYQDHWSYFDDSIGIYNFLQYSQSRWKSLNPSLHYQNRLRHRDFLEMFDLTGLRILSVDHLPPREEHWNAVKEKGIDQEFQSRYSEEELKVPVGFFTLST